jgi:hypothetical protein
MYSKSSLPIVAVSLLVLSCGAPPQKIKPDKPASTPASIQAATKPLDKTPHTLVKLEIGDTAKTLDSLYAKLPRMINSEQLRYNLNREFKAAAADVDLTQGTEAALGYADDTLGFVVFSFALQKDNHFAEKLKTPAGLDTKGHQLAVRPLPGSLLSPFNHVLYLDIKGDRLFITDNPEGFERLPLKSGLSTPTLKASIAFASLWYVFGMPYQEAYIADKNERQFKAPKDAPPQPKQSDIFWESLFITAGSIKTIDVEADTRDGLLVSISVSTKKALTSQLDGLPGDPYEIVPGSQFGFRAAVPKSVMNIIAEARRKLAPPGFDTLAMFYPLSGTMSGSLFFGAGIDPIEGFWSVGQYPIEDSALARIGVQRYFSETPKPDAMLLDPGRSFAFTPATTKAKDGSVVDIVSSKVKEPAPLDLVLQINDIETHYKITSTQAITSTGKSGERYAALLEQNKKPQTIPAALATLLSRPMTAAQPASQPASSQPTSQTSESAPFAFFWLSQEGINSIPSAPVDAAATLSLRNGALLFKIAMLP